MLLQGADCRGGVQGRTWPCTWLSVALMVQSPSDAYR